MAGPDDHYDLLTGNLTGRFRAAFNARDIETLRSLYAPGAASVIEPGIVTTGPARAEILDHFFSTFDACESSIRHVYVAADVALLVVDWP